MIAEPDQSYQRTPSTLSAAIDEDFVALQVERGNCFGMQEVGAAIWAALETPVTLDALVTRLRENYDVDETSCRADVESFLSTLLSEGLIEPAQ